MKKKLFVVNGLGNTEFEREAATLDRGDPDTKSFAVTSNYCTSNLQGISIAAAENATHEAIKAAIDFLTDLY